MSERASKKQQALLEYIDDFIKTHGYGPSYREVMGGLDYKSVSTVATHIDGLIARGYLRKSGRSARSLEIVTLRAADTTIAGHDEQSDHKKWLETEIRQRIHQGKKTDEAETLLAAARLLGLSNGVVTKLQEEMLVHETTAHYVA